MSLIIAHVLDVIPDGTGLGCRPFRYHGEMHHIPPADSKLLVPPLVPLGPLDSGGGGDGGGGGSSDFYNASLRDEKRSVIGALR